MSGAKRAKHIYFDIEYWRWLEKTFADSAAKYATDDNIRSIHLHFPKCAISGEDDRQTH